MRSFFDNVPEELVPELRTLIESLRETQALLLEVRERFGTDDPEALKKLTGETIDGVTVSEESINELEVLKALNEERRDAIRQAFLRISGGAPSEIDPPKDIS